MKIKNRILSLAISASIIASCLASISAMAAEAVDPTEGGPEIVSQNIAYTGNFGLLYAIDAATVEGGSVKVNVYDADMNFVGSYSAYQKTITTADGTTYTDAYIVETPGVGAKDMADVYYAQAVDGAGNASKIKRYSVGEYLYERLYANGIVNATEGTTDYNKKVFYQNVLSMGASAQTVLINDKLANGAAKETLVTDYKYINVTGGTLADGYTAGIFAEGTSVTVTHTGTAPENQEQVGWKSAGATYNSDTITLNDHAVISPVYSSTVIDFENDKIPASISYQLNSTSATCFITSQHGRKCLYLRTYNDGADVVQITPTAKAEADYNAVVLDTMIQLHHNGPSTTYFQNFAFTDAEGNIAYKFTLRHGDAGIQFNDGSDNNQTLIASKSTWFNLRIEYTYIDANNVTINTYVNDSLVYESTNFVGDVAIKNVSVFKLTTDTGIGASVFYDDISFKQIKK